MFKQARWVASLEERNLDCPKLTTVTQVEGQARI